MTTINLKDHYPWYTEDTFMEVPDEIAAFLDEDRRLQINYAQYIRDNKAFYLPQALSALAENGVWLQSIAEQEMLLTYPFTSLLMLPPPLQWQMAVYNVWQTYRRNAENSD